MRKAKYLVSLILCLVAAFACFACGGGNDGDNGGEQPAPKVTVSVATKTVTITEGDSYDLSQLGASSSDGAAVSFVISEGTAVTISDNILTAVSGGQAKITVSSATAENTVTVTVVVNALTRYTVTVDGNAEVYVAGSAVDRPADPTKPSTDMYDYTFDGWYIVGTDTKYDFIANGDVSVEARFIETLKKFTVSIDGNAEVYDAGSAVAKPADPTKPSTDMYDYTFDGWYIVGTDTKYDFIANGDVSVEARFIETLRKYTVTIDGNSKVYDAGSAVTKPDDPTKPSDGQVNYTFIGWYIVGTDTKYDFIALGDVSVEPRFTESTRQYTITVDGKTEMYLAGSAVTKPADPTKSSTDKYDYTFDGWYIVGTDTKYDFIASGDVSVEARFIETLRKYTVTIDGNAEVYDAGSAVAKPADPTKPSTDMYDYTFDGWYIVGTDTKYDFIANGDVSVESRFTETLRKYTVTIDGNSKVYDAGSAVTKPADPTKPSDGQVNYTFIGWYIVGTDTKYDFVAMGDVSVEARFAESTVQYTVTIDGNSQKYDVGSAVTKPADPTKPSTDMYDYTFDGWYIAGTDTKYDFIANGNVNVVSRFTETLRKYTVSFDGKATSVEYGAKAVKPADPTKESDDEDYIYEFAGWYNGDTEWNFDTAVTGDVALTAKFNKIAKEYPYVFRLKGESVDLPGVTRAPLFELTADDYAEMSAVIVDSENNETEVDIVSGKISLSLVPGKYTLKVTYKDTVSEQSFRVLKMQGEGEIAITQSVELGGKLGGYVGDNYYEYVSFGGNYKVADGAITVTGISYAYIGGVVASDKYYYEADVEFSSVGKMMGLLPAAEFGNLSNDSDKKLQGEDDKLKKKFVLSFSGGNKLYYQHTNGWSSTGLKTLSYVNTATAEAASYKIGLLRDGNYYYIFLNDVLITRYYTDEYGKSGFGFCSTDSGTIKFSNVKYTVRAATVDAILDEYDNGIYLGGSMTYPDGPTYNSFGGGWTLTSHDSGTIKGPSYLYANDVMANTYYMEVTLDKQANWVGLLVNTSDGEPQTNTGWYGYGVYNNSTLFLHELKTTWSDGTNKGAVSVGSGTTYKLAVARLHDMYYVYINDKLVISEKLDVKSTKDNTVSLAADNMSAIGIFCGQNYKNTTTFTDFWYTIDRSEIAKKIGGAEIEFDGDKVSVTQSGETVKSGATVLANQTVSVKANIPDGKVIEKFDLYKDGVKISVTASDGAISFVPELGASYSIEVVYADKSGQATLNLTVKSVSRKVAGTAYELYDLDIDPSAVTVRLLDFTSGTETVGPLDSLSKSYSLSNGYYQITVEYASIIYEYFVTLADGDVLDLDGYVSAAYIGGSITIPNDQGVETTYKSYNNASETAEKGANWRLVDGQRDTVTVVSHTYAFQKGVSGTKYYVEGTFDSTNEYTLYSGIGGLLIAHGPKNLADSSDMKLIASIWCDKIVLAVCPAWSAAYTSIIADYSEVVDDYDPTAVRLGVVRDGQDYWFFVNDEFVCYYYYAGITTECGVGVAGIPATVTISKFNYSLNTEFIDALKASAPEQKDKEIDIYLIAGQSNASGYSSYNLESAREVDERLVYGFNNIMYAGDAESTSGSSAVHRELNWGLVRIGQGRSSSHFGAEAGMAISLSSYYNTESGKTAGIIKYAHGGTSLLDNIGGENAASGNWVPPSYEATITPQSKDNITGGLYRGLLAQITENVAQLKKMGYTKINVKGLFWMQGEADLSSLTEYKKAFGYFVSDIRKDVGEIVDADLSDMAIIIGEVSETFSSADQATVDKNKKFIALQNEMAEQMDEVYTVKSGELHINELVNGTSTVLGTDRYHWNQADMLSIGKLVGECIKTNLL